MFTGHRAVVVLAGWALLGCNSPRTPVGNSSDESTSPILYDQQSLSGPIDISGLEAGRHELEFNAYVPKLEQWTGTREQQLTQSIRVAHVPTRIMAVTRVSLSEIEGRADARRVRLEMNLDRPGPWVIKIVSNDLRPALAEPFSKQRYAVPEMVKHGSLDDSSDLGSNILLRTIGACNHVYKVAALSDDQQVLKTIRLVFSEPIVQEGWKDALKITLFDVDGKRVADLDHGELRITDKVAEFELPPQPGQQGLLKLSVSESARLAGRFNETFSCAPAETLLGVGYSYGGQPSVEHLEVALTGAASRAFEGPK